MKNISVQCVGFRWIYLQNMIEVEFNIDVYVSISAQQAENENSCVLIALE